MVNAGYTWRDTMFTRDVFDSYVDLARQEALKTVSAETPAL